MQPPVPPTTKHHQTESNDAFEHGNLHHGVDRHGFRFFLLSFPSLFFLEALLRH